MSSRFLPVAVAILALMPLPLFAQDGGTSATQPSVSLPGGATSLREQHGDWAVNCAIVEAAKRCGFSQELVASQSGQRVLSLELDPIVEGRIEGMFVTPFSLRLDTGVRLSIDDNPLDTALPFLSCIEIGCLVPVAFEGDVLNALYAGNQLQVTAVALSSNQPVTLALSLTGFTAASNRTAELARE